jgi:hypothetical protein
VYRVPENPMGLYEVGHYSPDGEFYCVAVSPSSSDAQDKVHLLNGGTHPKVVEHLQQITSNVGAIAHDLMNR